VKILAENGVPGLLVLGGFVLSFAVTGLRSRIRSLRRLGLMTTAVLALAFTSTEYQNKGVWFLAAITIAMMGPTSPLRPARAPSAPRTR
jgi:heme/copper-type cytochrome/quinol oxidase subunit 3